jgi:phosphoglycerate-specific signal transduction histidine kinase
MTELRHWATQWGDIASIVGVLLTIAGFIVTIIIVWRSKSAAEHASQAARDTRDSIARHNAIVDLTAAMTIMDEIKRLQRNGVWAVIPDRYSQLRQRLTAIKAAHADLSDAQRQKLEEAVGTFARLERKVDRAVLENTTPPIQQS